MNKCFVQNGGYEEFCRTIILMVYGTAQLQSNVRTHLERAQHTFRTRIRCIRASAKPCNKAGVRLKQVTATPFFARLGMHPEHMLDISEMRAGTRANITLELSCTVVLTLYDFTCIVTLLHYSLNYYRFPINATAWKQF